MVDYIENVNRIVGVSWDEIVTTLTGICGLQLGVETVKFFAGADPLISGPPTPNPNPPTPRGYYSTEDVVLPNGSAQQGTQTRAFDCLPDLSRYLYMEATSTSSYVFQVFDGAAASLFSDNFITYGSSPAQWAGPAFTSTHVCAAYSTGAGPDHDIEFHTWDNTTGSHSSFVMTDKTANPGSISFDILDVCPLSTRDACVVFYNQNEPSFQDTSYMRVVTPAGSVGDRVECVRNFSNGAPGTAEIVYEHAVGVGFHELNGWQRSGTSLTRESTKDFDFQSATNKPSQRNTVVFNDMAYFIVSSSLANGFRDGALGEIISPTGSSISHVGFHSTEFTSTLDI